MKQMRRIRQVLSVVLVLILLTSFVPSQLGLAVGVDEMESGAVSEEVLTDDLSSPVELTDEGIEETTEVPEEVLEEGNPEEVVETGEPQDNDIKEEPSQIMVSDDVTTMNEVPGNDAEPVDDMLQETGEGAVDEAPLQNAPDQDRPQDHLHLSVDLEWDIADDDQLYNQHVVTTSQGILQPTYRLTVQTSSVIYDTGKLEVRLPAVIFTERSTNGGKKVWPSAVSCPEQPEASEGSSFSYYYDMDTEEIVFVNNKTVYAGTNDTIEVRYDVNANAIVDLDSASFQAIATGQARDEENGTYPIDRDESPVITYSLDTGLQKIDDYGGNFIQYAIRDGYRYYRVNVFSFGISNQPANAVFSVDFLGTNGEIVGPKEYLDQGRTMTLEEFSEYYSFVSNYLYEEDPTTFNTHFNTDVFYVRYPDTGDEETDQIEVRLNLVAWDDDDHTPPGDMNDLLNTSIRFSNKWAKYPPKPVGLWYKNPIGQERERGEFLLPILRGSNTTHYEGPARFVIGCDAGTPLLTDDGGKLVITDTGLVKETGNEPDLSWEISNLRFPMFNDNGSTGVVYAYDEDTQQYTLDNDWFETMTVEGSVDGTTWDLLFEMDAPLHGWSGYYNTSEYFIGKGYRQVRVTFDGIKENRCFYNRVRPNGPIDLLEVHVHGTNPTIEYMMRQELDQYRNWMEIHGYNSEGTELYEVRDWGMLTLYPYQSGGNSTLVKSVLREVNDTTTESVDVVFEIESNYAYQIYNSNLLDSSSYDTGSDLELDIQDMLLEQVPDFADQEPLLNDVEKIVTYDLLPPGYRFKEIPELGDPADHFSGSVFAFTGARMAWVNRPRNYITYEVINNYKGSDRQLVIFTFDAAAHNRAFGFDASRVMDLRFKFYYTATIDWEDLVFYQNEHNLVVQQLDDGRDIPRGRPDDGAPAGSDVNLSVFAEATDASDRALFYDINGDGVVNGRDTVYAYATVSPNVVQGGMTGIRKHIRGESGIWQEIDRTDVNLNYQYRVRVMNGGGSGGNLFVKDLIVYDTLEDAANTELYTGEKTWKGSFVSVDTSYLEKHGVAPVVYYSTETDLSKLDYNNVTGREDEIWIDDTSIWSSTLPADPSKVTAVAVDCRWKADGSEMVLQEDQGIQFIINMKAPPEYPTLLDPEMVYAINRPAYHSYQYVRNAANGTYFTDIGRRVKISLEPVGSLTIKKISEGQETPENAMFTVTGPNNFSQTFYYRDMVDGVFHIPDLQMGTYTIKESFYDYDEAFSVTFDGAANATSEMVNWKRESSGEAVIDWDNLDKVVTIKNVSSLMDIPITKTWGEREDVTAHSYEIIDFGSSSWLAPFPSSRLDPYFVLYQNGELYQMWDYIMSSSFRPGFTDLPRTNPEDESEYVYSVEEYFALKSGTERLFRASDSGSNVIFKTVKSNFLKEKDTIELIVVRENYRNWKNEIIETIEVDGSLFAEDGNQFYSAPSRGPGGVQYGYWFLIEPSSVGYMSVKDGEDFTNIRLMNVTAKKEWELPPSEEPVDVTLYLNKTVNGKTQKVEGSERVIAADATDNTVEWTGLPEYEDGHPVQYAVAEEEGSGYIVKSITGNDLEGFVVTNKLIPEQPPIEKKVNEKEHDDLPSIEEPFTYTITTVMPTGDKEGEKVTLFQIFDTLKPVLEFDMETPVIVTVDGEEVSPAITRENKKLTVTFSEEEVTAAPKKPVSVTFKAKIEEGADLSPYAKEGSIRIENVASYQINDDPEFFSKPVTVTPPVEPPTIEKKVNGTTHVDLVSKTDLFTYTITTQMPIGTTEKEKVTSFQVIDNLESVLAFDMDSPVKVLVDGKEATPSISRAGKRLQVLFNEEEVAAAPGKEIVVTFVARIEEGADLSSYMVEDKAQVPNRASYQINNEDEVYSEVVTVTPPEEETPPPEPPVLQEEPPTPPPTPSTPETPKRPVVDTSDSSSFPMWLMILFSSFIAFVLMWIERKEENQQSPFME